MVDLAVKHYAHVVPVVVDENGRPFCPCCHEPMLWEGTDRWACPTWTPILEHLRPGIQRMFDHLLNGEAQNT